MSFASPLYLLALLAVPVVVAAYVWHDRRRSGVADRFASPALLPNVVDREPGRLRHVPPAVLLVALAALLSHSRDRRPTSRCHARTRRS